MAIFHRLDCSHSRFVELAEGNDWEGVVCPMNDGHQRAGRRITSLHVNLISKRAVDFSSTVLSNTVITDDALKILIEAKLTGFRVEPLVVHSLAKGMAPDAVPRLWELLITGSGGRAHPDSGITLKYRCESCGLVRYSAYEHGIVIDEHAYDGSDFFTVTEYPAYILVNARAKAAIESSGLSGAKFIESSKLEWPEGVIKP